VRVQDIHLVRFQMCRKPSQLAQRSKIVKTSQLVFWNLTQVEAIDFGA